MRNVQDEAPGVDHQLILHIGYTFSQIPFNKISFLRMLFNEFTKCTLLYYICKLLVDFTVYSDCSSFCRFDLQVQFFPLIAIRFHI